MTAEVHRRELRVVEDRRRVALGDDLAALHHDAVGRQAHPEPDVLLDDEDRLAALLEHHHRVVDRPQRLRVEPERRLVQQEQHRVEHQRAGELHHPSLAAGQVAGVLVAALGDDREQVGDLVVPLLHQRLLAPDDVGAEQDVLAHGHVGEERVGLRHLGDAAAQDVGGGTVVDALAIEVDLATPRRQQAADRLQDRGLAGTVRPDDAGHRPPGDADLDALQHVAAAVPGDHAGQPQEVVAHRFFASSGTSPGVAASAASSTKSSPR